MPSRQARAVGVEASCMRRAISPRDQRRLGQAIRRSTLVLAQASRTSIARVRTGWLRRREINERQQAPSDSGWLDLSRNDSCVRSFTYRVSFRCVTQRLVCAIIPASSVSPTQAGSMCHATTRVWSHFRIERLSDVSRSDSGRHFRIECLSDAGLARCAIGSCVRSFTYRASFRLGRPRGFVHGDVECLPRRT